MFPHCKKEFVGELRSMIEIFFLITYYDAGILRQEQGKKNPSLQGRLQLS